MALAASGAPVAWAVWVALVAAEVSVVLGDSEVHCSSCEVSKTLTTSYMKYSAVVHSLTHTSIGS